MNARVPDGWKPQSDQTVDEYRIGPEDLLQLDVFQVPDLSREVRVNSRGEISLPLVDTVNIAGLTREQAQEEIARKLGERYLHDPQVTISVKEFISQRVTVEGLVKKPGVYPLAGPTTLLQVIAMSEGVNETADSESIQVFRSNGLGQRELFVYNIDSIRSGQAPDPYVKRDDIIVVREHSGKAFRKGVTDTVQRMIHIGGAIPLF